MTEYFHSTGSPRSRPHPHRHHATRGVAPLRLTPSGPGADLSSGVNDDTNQSIGAPIRARRSEIAAAAVARLYERHPEFEVRHGTGGRARCVEDVCNHLMYLAEAISTESPHLFEEHAAWSRSFLDSHGVPASDFIDSLRALRDELAAAAPPVPGEQAARYVSAALDVARRAAEEPPCRIDTRDRLGALAASYLDALLRGDRAQATKLVMDEVDAGTPIRDIYLGIFQPAQHELGRLWQLNRISVAQEHFCTAATQMIMSLLAPKIFSTPRRGTSAICTCVGGDLHEIGARMVSDFLELDGWDAFYLGANAPAESIVEEAASRAVDVVAISATMPYHITHVAELIAALRDEPATSQKHIIVGGHAFNRAPGLWLQIGADATAPDAPGAVDVARAAVAETRA